LTFPVCVGTLAAIDLPRRGKLSLAGGEETDLTTLKDIPRHESPGMCYTVY